MAVRVGMKEFPNEVFAEAHRYEIDDQGNLELWGPDSLLGSVAAGAWVWVKLIADKEQNDE